MATYGYGSNPPNLGDPTQVINSASTGNGPSVVGAGMYQAAPITIDQNAFNNSVGAQAGQQLSGQLNNYLGSADTPVTAAQANTGVNSAYTSGIGGQQGIANQYQGLINGTGPSAANVAAEQAGQANLANSLAMLGSSRGAANPAAAQLAARTAMSTTGNQIAQNQVAGRTNEELGAMNAAGSLYGNIAGQGLQQQGLQQNQAQFNAGQANSVAQGNQANNLAANTNYLNTLNSINGQQQQGQIAGQQLGAQTALGADQIAANAYNNAATNNNNAFKSVVGAASSAIGPLAALSDKRLKENIKNPSKKDMDDFIQLGRKL